MADHRRRCVHVARQCPGARGQRARASRRACIRPCPLDHSDGWRREPYRTPARTAAMDRLSWPRHHPLCRRRYDLSRLSGSTALFVAEMTIMRGAASYARKAVTTPTSSMLTRLRVQVLWLLPRSRLSAFLPVLLAI